MTTNNMEQLNPSDLKAILHSKRANLYYLEHARVMQKDGRVLYLTEAKSKNQYWNIPIANTTVILLGTGTSITQAAMRMLCSAGVLVGFCGGGGTPLLAILNLNDFNQPIFENEYAYQPPLDDTTEYDNLTESLTMIKDSGLINYIAQKHGNVDPTHHVKRIPDKKQQARCAILENYARDADYPLYLSYIEDDLNKIGGTGVRYPEAIYYATSDKQPIGSISLDKLNFLTTKQEGK